MMRFSYTKKLQLFSFLLQPLVKFQIKEIEIRSEILKAKIKKTVIKKRRHCWHPFTNIVIDKIVSFDKAFHFSFS